MASTLLTTSPATYPVDQQVVTAPVPTTPSSNWTEQVFTDANTRHEFITVGIPNRNRVTIQDSYDIWDTNPAILFQTGYRIAGSREDITADLKAAGMTDEQIDGVLGSTVSSENYLTDMAGEFHKEMKEYIAWNRTAVKVNTVAPGNTLFGTMSTLNPSLLATPNKPRVANVNAGVNVGGPGRKVEPIAQKLQKLAAGYYLDVSNMDEFGRKTKPITADKLAGRVGSARIPIVSNKLDRYLAAINMIPGGNETYAEDIAFVTQALGGQAATGYYPQQPQQLQQAQPQQVPFTPAGAPGFQPFTPQPNGNIIPQSVAPILTGKQRKQKKAAAQMPFPGFQQAQAPIFPNAVPGMISGARRQLDFNNIMTADDEDEYYDDEDNGDFYDNAPVQYQQPQYQQAPQPQYQPQQVQQPRPTGFPTPIPIAMQPPRAVGYPAPIPLQQPRAGGFPTQQPLVRAPLQQFPTAVPLVQPAQRSPPVPLVPITMTAVPLVPVRSPQIPQQPQQTQSTETPLM